MIPMKRHKKERWLMASLMAASILALMSQAKAAELLQGRCHMDYCSWFTTESRDTIGTSSRGSLIKVESRWWQSHHPNGSYNRRAPRKGGDLGTDYFFCSKSAPAVIDLDRDTGKWIATKLAPGNPDNIAGYNTTAYLRYFSVCHGVTVTEETLYDQTVTLGRKFGYRVVLDLDDTQITLNRPEDILIDK